MGKDFRPTFQGALPECGKRSMILKQEGDDTMTTTRWPIAGSLAALTLVVGNSPLRGGEGTEQIIADLKTKDMKAARKYYDKWIGKWR